jgi:hypothetical protein
MATREDLPPAQERLPAVQEASRQATSSTNELITYQHDEDATHRAGNGATKQQALFMRSLMVGGGLLLLGFILLLVFSMSADRDKGQVFAAAVLTSAAALVVGALLGFLFALPRYREEESPGQPIRSSRLTVNANLEQISDWLTKILVGIGLIELGRIGPGLGNLVTDLGLAFGGSPTARTTAGATLAFYSVMGFLMGYLLTRTLLTQILDEFMSLEQRADQASRLAAHQGQKLVTVTRAIDVASTMLRGAQGSPEELAQLLKDADESVRSTIFSMVQQQQYLNWAWEVEEEADVKLNKQSALIWTIPVLRAFTAAIPNDPKYHGELGIVLKDAYGLDNPEARRELELAVELASEGYSNDRAGWWHYNLAMILAAEDMRDHPADTSGCRNRDRTLILLRRAAGMSTIITGLIQSLIRKEETKFAANRVLSNWLEACGITEDDIIAASVAPPETAGSYR